MAKLVIEFVISLLIGIAVITFSVLFKSPLNELIPLLNSVMEWIVANYLMCIIIAVVIFLLLLLKKLLIGK